MELVLIGCAATGFGIYFGAVRSFCERIGLI